MDTAGHIKISDFSLAVTNIFAGKMISGRAGTLRYMAPEMLLMKPYDAVVDWFSCGVILYELAIGRYPFYSCSDALYTEWSVISSVPSYPHHLDPHLKNILERLLCKLPLSRQLSSRSIRAHPFFSPCDWEEVENGTSDPPFTMEPNPESTSQNHMRMDEMLSSVDPKKPPISDTYRRLLCGFSYVNDTWNTGRSHNT
ncbi:protein kinase C delta type-like [Mixophyes fleayi]|uniref:protein kinase C delta type-like n=1 Tax=Mixophyes fleayi TaxID=3061075 RepID=UPI003F4D733E